MSTLAAHWALDPSLHLLNHGSYGAAPRAVLAAQAALTARIEANTHGFFNRELEALVDAARTEVARFVGVAPERFAFVRNATEGVNAALMSLAPTLAPGDALVCSDHGYNACANVLRRVAEARGAHVHTVNIGLDGCDADAVLGRFLGALGPRVRAVLVDHVTSPTGLIFPVAELARACAARGVAVVVDGAHAAGLVDLALDPLFDAGVSVYTGNLHKWTCAPKGAAFIAAAPDFQRALRPAITSHGANSPRTDRAPFWLEFDWCGTFDPTPWLCAPVALCTVAAMVPGGFGEVMARNNDLARRGLRCLEAAGFAAVGPDAMRGPMASVVLGGLAPGQSLAFMHQLWRDHQIEVPVIAMGDRALLRISAHLYNQLASYEHLARVLPEALARAARGL